MGKEVSGDGLIGMTRGLMYAGTKRVTVSLWNVQDQATADLMERFYSNLWGDSPSITHAAAFADAQRQMWKTGKSPNAWAAFVMHGEWRN